MACTATLRIVKLPVAVLLFLTGQRPAAIVSSYAGTTRDVLESALDIFGYPIVLRYTDTLSSSSFGLCVTHGI